MYSNAKVDCSANMRINQNYCRYIVHSPQDTFYITDASVLKINKYTDRVDIIRLFQKIQSMIIMNL